MPRLRARPVSAQFVRESLMKTALKHGELAQRPLTATRHGGYNSSMTATTRYTGVPGFDLGEENVATPSPTTDLTQSLRENSEFLTDLCRYAEGTYSESAVRKRWKLSEETWELLGSDDELVRAIDELRIQRVRSGALKREKAQFHVIRGPDVLATIMDDPKANARHRVDSVRALNAIADPGPEAAAEQERIFIKIDLSADTKDPKDVLTIEAATRPSTPKQIEDDHNEQPNDEWRR